MSYSTDVDIEPTVKCVSYVNKLAEHQVTSSRPNFFSDLPSLSLSEPG